jgi:hypothetical protein
MSSSSVARFKFSNLLGKGMQIQILDVDGSWIRIVPKCHGSGTLPLAVYWVGV